MIRRVLIALGLLASSVGASTCGTGNRKPEAAPAAAARLSMKDVCRPPENIEHGEAIVQGGSVGQDGRVRFTFQIEDGVPDAQAAAFREAIKRWNDWSHVTGIRLEEGAKDGPIDVTFGKSDLTRHPENHCAVHEPWSSSVRYNPKTMGFAETDAMLAAATYVHEIGHVFGIDHPADGSLMDETSYRKSATCQEGAGKLKDIDARDAERALYCSFIAQYARRKPLRPWSE